MSHPPEEIRENLAGLRDGLDVKKSGDSAAPAALSAAPSTTENVLAILQEAEGLNLDPSVNGSAASRGPAAAVTGDSISLAALMEQLDAIGKRLALACESNVVKLSESTLAVLREKISQTGIKEWDDIVGKIVSGKFYAGNKLANELLPADSLLYQEIFGTKLFTAILENNQASYHDILPEDYAGTSMVWLAGLCLAAMFRNGASLNEVSEILKEVAVELKAEFLSVAGEQLSTIFNLRELRAPSTGKDGEKAKHVNIDEQRRSALLSPVQALQLHIFTARRVAAEEPNKDGEDHFIKTLECFVLTAREFMEASMVMHSDEKLPPAEVMKQTCLAALATLDIDMFPPENMLSGFMTEMMHAIVMTYPASIRQACEREIEAIRPRVEAPADEIARILDTEPEQLKLSVRTLLIALGVLTAAGFGTIQVVYGGLDGLNKTMSGGSMDDDADQGVGFSGRPFEQEADAGIGNAKRVDVDKNQRLTAGKDQKPPKVIKPKGPRQIIVTRKR